jgi:hypothetical protein
LNLSFILNVSYDEGLITRKHHGNVVELTAMYKICSPHRRFARFAFFTALALAFVFGTGGSEAKASCGDYLMPLDIGHEEVFGGRELNQATLAKFSGFQSRRHAPPCSGPGCGQSPESDWMLTVLPRVERQSSPGMIVQAIDCGAPKEADRPTTMFDCWVVEQNFIGGIFRPPRAEG